MHTVKLKIEDDIYGHIMFLLKNLNSTGIEIISDKSISKDNKIIYDLWEKKELESIGKIGFHSKSFVDDEEDYSKW